MNTQQIECALVRPPQVEPENNSMPYKDAGALPGSTYGIGKRITCVDRAIIRRHFDGCHAALTTDATQRQKWLTGSKLPSKLRFAQLPRDLEFRLSPLGAGYQRVTVGRDVLLIEVAMRRIVDVMQNADAMMM